MGCYCGKEPAYEQCCQPFHTGAAQPETAEMMMRSRYSAFCVQEIDYLIETCLPAQRAGIDKASIAKWAADSDWLGLEIKSCTAGLQEDDVGYVEFIARYKDAGIQREHKERACFRREDGQWYFDEDRVKEVETFVRTEKKVGRNDPCPCGSGKKHKKCCG